MTGISTNQQGQNFVRVTSRQPCPVCGKPDWCLRTPDGAAAICARVKSGKPMGKRDHAGWLHLVGYAQVGRSASSRQMRTCRPNCSESNAFAIGDKSAGDFVSLSQDYVAALAPEQLSRIATWLGLAPLALQQLDLGWSAQHSAYSFPMRDAARTVIGIRLRSAATGKKFAVRGGRQGLFIPAELGSGQLFIAEGPTDCAALLGLGFDAVGRPSCSGGVRLLTELVKVRRPSQIVIVADADAPGQAGAERLADVLVAYVPVRILTPPAKDAREWLGLGVAHDEVIAAVNAASARKLRISIHLCGEAK